MSYQVLARKWRPRSFDSLIGQDHVVKALTHALDQKRLHHAYLFTGTRGVGKTTIARILAKALNCDTGVSSKPCGKCPACTEIDAGRFVDYVEMDAASYRGVDEMVDLLERAVYAPSAGRYKVYMIDEVHQLSSHAFNAMLKTLEEPPEHMLFILATTDPQKVPVTVLSRCLQFNLKQMPAPVISAHLEHILSEEKIAAAPAGLRLIASGAKGSMRDALSLLDQAIAFSGGDVSEEDVRDMLGTVDDAYLYSILEAVAADDVKGAISVAEDMEARSVSFEGALQALATLLHRVALAQSAPEALSDDAAQKERVLALARSLDPEEIQLCYQIAVHGRRDLALAPDEFAGFTMVILRMIAFRPENDETAPARQEKPAAAKAGQPKSAPQADSQPVAPSEIDWPGIARSLGTGGVAKQLAQQSELVRFDGETLELRLPSSAKHLAEQVYQEKLKGALQAHFGKPVRLEVGFGDTSGNTAQDRAAAAIHQDAFVRDLMEQFDATIVQSSIKPVQ